MTGQMTTTGIFGKHLRWRKIQQTTFEIHSKKIAPQIAEKQRGQLMATYDTTKSISLLLD